MWGIFGKNITIFFQDEFFCFLCLGLEIWHLLLCFINFHLQKNRCVSVFTGHLVQIVEIPTYKKQLSIKIKPSSDMKM